MLKKSSRKVGMPIHLTFTISTHYFVQFANVENFSSFQCKTPLKMEIPKFPTGQTLFFTYAQNEILLTLWPFSLLLLSLLFYIFCLAWNLCRGMFNV